MALLTTGSLLTDQLIKALGNTLIHSLWQGILLAIAGGLIIVFTKRSSAALRYNLLIGAMLLFTCGIIVTFITQLQPLHTNTAIYQSGKAAVNLPVVNDAPSPTINHVTEQQSATGVLTGFLNKNCNTIVLIWFLIICIKGVKLAVGGYEVYHLKHSKVYSVSAYWDNRLAHLSAQLKIKQAVQLLESGIAKVPMVIGHLKPVILIPVGFINALSSEEVEAILVHELAHIRRRDYLVNLLQSFMEIVFFFNPAVIWISQLIKAERENCCDDIAIAQAGDKGSYIQALLSCQEYQHAAPGLSMALATNKSTLLNRVKRIVNNHNQSLNIMEKTLLTICMVTAGLFTVAFSAKDAAKQPAANLKQAKQHTVTVDPKVTYLFKTNNDKTYKFNKTNTKITGLSINGKKIPDSQVANHRPQIDALLKANENAKKQQAKEDTSLKAGKSKIYDPADFNDGTSMGMREVKNGKPFAVYLFKREGVLYQVFMDRNKVAELYVNGKIAPANDYRSQIDRMLEEYKSLIAPPVPAIAPVPPVSPKVIGMIAPAPHVSPVPAIAGVPGPAVPATPAQPTPLAIINAVPAVAPVAPLGMVNADGLYTKVTDKLIKEGIIKDKNNFDINITNDDLEVDGVKQPEAIHQQVLKIYGKKLGDKINWHYSNHN